MSSLVDIRYKVRNDSIADLIGIENIQTTADIEKYRDEGYVIGYTISEFKEKFPLIDATKIFFCPNELSPTYYFDKEKYILFPVHLFGTQSMSLRDDFETDINNTVKQFVKLTTGNDYSPAYIALNDRMRVEYIKLLLEGGKTEGVYKTFKDFYKSSDYGCNSISHSDMKKLMELKTSEDKEETALLIKELPNDVIVYRGEGDRSSPAEQAYSWSLDINQANLFAARYGYQSKIIKAKTSKNKVLEYFDVEKECLIMPEDITVIETMELYGEGFYKALPKKVKVIYHYYRDVMAQFLKFKTEKDHDMPHSARVLFICLVLAYLYELDIESTKILAEAAISHDLGRVHDGEDDTHGYKSAELYKNNCKIINIAFRAQMEQGDFALRDNWKNAIEYDFVDFLICYHCLPDEIGFEKIKQNAEKYQEWRDKEEKITLLYKIFKDADGLDRVRLGNILGDLDLNQIRLPESKRMTLLARILFENLKVEKIKSQL